jgi:plasmid stability protein
MPDVLVRNVDAEVLTKLKERAKENGRSLQNELVQIFQTLAESSGLSDEETARKIKKSLRGRKFSDSAELLREDRNR